MRRVPVSPEWDHPPGCGATLDAESMGPLSGTDGRVREHAFSFLVVCGPCRPEVREILENDAVASAAPGHRRPRRQGAVDGGGASAHSQIGQETASSIHCARRLERCCAPPSRVPRWLKGAPRADENQASCWGPRRRAGGAGELTPGLPAGLWQATRRRRNSMLPTRLKPTGSARSDASLR